MRHRNGCLFIRSSHPLLSDLVFARNVRAALAIWRSETKDRFSGRVGDALSYSIGLHLSPPWRQGLALGVG